MTEALRLARKKQTRKNQGGGQGDLPLRRKFVRERIEQKSRYGGNELMGNTRTQQEINALKATLAMPVDERIARMETFIEDLDKEAAITGTGTEEMRMSGSRLIDQDAVKLTESRDDDHGQAVRQAVAGVRQSTREDDETVGSIHYMDRSDYEQQMREAVERRMKADQENYLD